MYGQGPFGKALDISAQLTNGVCPVCNHEGLFVSITPELFRCTSCGSDCKQYINGSIRYLPAISRPPEASKDAKIT
jgi:uncharacterized protein (DUF983 family)